MSTFKAFAKRGGHDGLVRNPRWTKNARIRHENTSRVETETAGRQNV